MTTARRCDEYAGPAGGIQLLDAPGWSRAGAELRCAVAPAPQHSPQANLYPHWSSGAGPISRLLCPLGPAAAIATDHAMFVRRPFRGWLSRCRCRCQASG